MFWLPPMLFGILSTLAAFLSLRLPDHSESDIADSIVGMKKTVTTISFTLKEKETE